MRECTRLFKEWRFQEALLASVEEASGAEDVFAACLCRLGMPYQIEHGLSKSTLRSPSFRIERAWSELEQERVEKARVEVAGLPPGMAQRRALEATMLGVPFDVHVSGREEGDELVHLLPGLWANSRDTEAEEAITLFRQLDPSDVRGPLLTMRLALARGNERLLLEGSSADLLKDGHPEAEYLRARFEMQYGTREKAERRLKAHIEKWEFDFRPRNALFQLRRPKTLRFIAAWPLLALPRMIQRIDNLRKSRANSADNTS